MQCSGVCVGVSLVALEYNVVLALVSDVQYFGDYMYFQLGRLAVFLVTCAHSVTPYKNRVFILQWKTSLSSLVSQLQPTAVNIILLSVHIGKTAGI